MPFGAVTILYVSIPYFYASVSAFCLQKKKNMILLRGTSITCCMAISNEHHTNIDTIKLFHCDRSLCALHLTSQSCVVKQFLINVFFFSIQVGSTAHFVGWLIYEKYYE